jgi:hypothetical protein
MDETGTIIAIIIMSHFLCYLNLMLCNILIIDINIV